MVLNITSIEEIGIVKEPSADDIRNYARRHNVSFEIALRQIREKLLVSDSKDQIREDF